MKLTNRLKTIADIITPNTIVGDIGSDHGYLVAYLIENKIINKAIASDINAGPVENCKQTVKNLGFEDHIDIRLGGGLLPYAVDEINTAVIAGMGGELIRDILIESPKVVESIEKFILQPMTGQDVLRKWLYNNLYTITEECIANEQDRYYEILTVVHNKTDIALPIYMQHIDQEDPIIFEIGTQMIVDEHYLGFIDKKIAKYNVIKKQIEKHVKEDHPKLKIANQNLENLKEVKRCIQTQKK